VNVVICDLSDFFTVLDTFYSIFRCRKRKFKARMRLNSTGAHAASQTPYSAGRTYRAAHGSNFDPMPFLPPPMTHMGTSGVEPRLTGYQSVALTTEPLFYCPDVDIYRSVCNCSSPVVETRPIHLGRNKMKQANFNVFYT